MNKKRKNDIRLIILSLQATQGRLQGILNDEEFTYDNIPENLQSSIRGMDSEDAIDIMQESVDKLEEVVDLLLGI